MRKPVPDEARCIAWVKRRVRDGTPEHRCRYHAHALKEAKVQLCRVHAGMRPRRKHREPGLEQLGLFA